MRYTTTTVVLADFFVNRRKGVLKINFYCKFAIKLIAYFLFFSLPLDWHHLCLKELYIFFEQ